MCAHSSCMVRVCVGTHTCVAFMVCTLRCDAAHSCVGLLVCTLRCDAVHSCVGLLVCTIRPTEVTSQFSIICAVCLLHFLAGYLGVSKGWPLVS